MTWHLIPLRAATLLDGPIERIRYSLTRVDVWERSAGALGLTLKRATPGSTTWADGEIVKFRPVPHREHSPGLISRALHGSGSWLAEMNLVGGLPVLTVRTGPAAGARVQFVLGPTGAGTVVTAELISTEPAGTDASTNLIHRVAALVQAPQRRTAVLALRTLLGILTLAMHENTVVVGAAIIRDGAVLAARRTYPARDAGKWEMPGGKADPGETDQHALIREVHEELDVTISVGEQIGPDVALDVEMVLRIYAATLQSGEPTTTEHDSLRWVRPEELSQVDWLDGDRALLAHVARVLTEQTSQR